MRSHLHKALTEESPYTEPQILYILEKLVQGQILLHKSPSKQAIIDMLLLQITESRTYLSLPQLAKRLLLLEKKLQDPSKQTATPVATQTPAKVESQESPTTPELKPAAIANTPEEPELKTPVSQENPIIPEPVNLAPPEFPQAPEIPVNTQPKAPLSPEPALPTPPPEREDALENHSSHYDNLMKFSEVELEGIIHKN